MTCITGLGLGRRCGRNATEYGGGTDRARGTSASHGGGCGFGSAGPELSAELESGTSGRVSGGVVGDLADVTATGTGGVRHAVAEGEGEGDNIESESIEDGKKTNARSLTFLNDVGD